MLWTKNIENVICLLFLLIIEQYILYNTMSENQNQNHNDPHGLLRSPHMVDWDSRLHLYQYDDESLRIIAQFVDLRTLLKTQRMSLDLIYDLYLDHERDMNHEKTSEEMYVSINEIIHYQRYTKEEIDEFIRMRKI
jgi:hypothetical protein